MLNKVIFLLMGVCLVSCGGSDSKEIQASLPTAKYAFAIVYDNYAWGTNHAGIYIESNGDLYSYLHKKGVDSYTDLTLDKEYAENEIANIFGDQATLLESIDTAAFNELKTKSLSINNDSLTKIEQVCADAGKFQLLTFEFNPISKNYQPVLIEQRGDWVQQNTSVNAEELKQWLEGKALDYQVFDFSFEECVYANKK